MSNRTKVNIAGPTPCKQDCRTTCHDGPHGTSGRDGDVRQCDHGRLWMWAYSKRGYYGNYLDHWRPLSRIWTPILYRRAVNALMLSERYEEASDE